MLLSLITTAVTASQILAAAKIATAVGSVCIAAQPVLDAVKNEWDD